MPCLGLFLLVLFLHNKIFVKARVCSFSLVVFVSKMKTINILVNIFLPMCDMVFLVTYINASLTHFLYLTTIYIGLQHLSWPLKHIQYMSSRISFYRSIHSSFAWYCSMTLNKSRNFPQMFHPWNDDPQCIKIIKWDVITRSKNSITIYDITSTF